MATNNKNFIHSKTKRAIKAELIIRDGLSCFYCGQALGDDITIEHLKPTSKGGDKTSRSNLVLAHSRCNNIAGTYSLIDKIKLRDFMRNIDSNDAEMNAIFMGTKPKED